MAIPIIGGIIDLVTTLGGSWLERKKIKAQGKIRIEQAKVDAALKRGQAEDQWDVEMAKASSNSWKDEWLTILVSIPLIMAFINDETRRIVTEGFEALTGMPPWYQYAIGIVFAASFGIKKASDIIGKWKSK